MPIFGADGSSFASLIHWSMDGATVWSSGPPAGAPQSAGAVFLAGAAQSAGAAFLAGAAQSADYGNDSMKSFIFQQFANADQFDLTT